MKPATGPSASAEAVATPPRDADRRRPNPQLWSGSADRLSLSGQIFALMAVVLAVLLLPVWWLSVLAAQDAAREDATTRAHATAATLAESPWVVGAVQSPDPTAVLSTPIETLRVENNLSFIVVMDPTGRRWTHPDPSQIGQQYLGSIAAAQAGGTVVEEFDGTLGRSVRVVVPITSGGRVIGLVAAGVLMDSVRQVATERALLLAGVALVALAVAWLGTWLVTRRIHSQTRGLGPLGLTRLHSYYEAMVHSVRAGLVLIGHDGTVVLCNDEARDLLGAEEAQPGCPVSALGAPPELAGLMASGRICEGETHVVGAKALVVTQVRAVLDGVDLGWVTTLRDRTDLMRLTGERDSLRAFSDMLRSRAHEADNRLHTVIMLVEMGRGEEAITFATETIEQSQALVDAVTDAVHDAPLAALLLGKSAQADERGVTLRLAEQLDIPETGLASGDILLVLGNLLDNAIDAASSGPAPRWVELDAHADASGELLFEVSDSGAGIPADRVEDAFRRGWSTKPSDPVVRPQGRGLGLSLVAGTVARLGGTIEVMGTPTRFVVRLPLPEKLEVDA